MQIRYKGGEQFEIKTLDVRVTLKNGLSVDGFVFPGPGEYEKAGIIAQGIADGENTIYVFRAEEINLCHLGNLKQILGEDKIKEIGDIDILFLPLGQNGTLPTKKALEVAAKIDPKIIIPMQFNDLTEFMKSEGVVDGEVETLKIKKADLPEEERQIVILKPVV